MSIVKRFATEDYVSVAVEENEKKFIKTINGNAPDENGNVEIEVPEASEPDLTGYATERYVQENYQPKGDYALASAIPTKVSQLTNDSKFATETYVNEKVAGLVNSAPETLNTLDELAAALGDNANFATTITTELGKKANSSELGALAKKNTVEKTDLASSVQTSLNKADSALQSYTETDPTVPAWAKAATKPSYTASEVGLGNVDNVKQYSSENPPVIYQSGAPADTSVVWVDPDDDSVEDVEDLIDIAIARAKESGEFDGAPGTSVTIESINESSEDGGSNVVKFSDGNTIHIKNGSKGTGVTPEFSIGTVETLPSGSSASASITGTAANPILNLGIPKGEAGGTSGGSQDVWELLDRTVLTEPVTTYSKTFDHSQKKLIAMIRPGVAVASGWKHIGTRSDGTYTFPLGNFAMTASEYLIVSIEDFAIINKRFIDWYAAETLPQNGMATAAKRGNGVFEIGIGNGYVTGPINAFVFATSGLLVEGAEIIIMGVKA
jgi:hypothetical protein